MKSQQAQVAKLCKQYLTKRGIECRTRSDSFSMGDSVSVDVYDQPPEVVREIEKELKQYQYGHFDGMTDCYESSNRRHDIPQTKYLHVNNKHSDALRAAAYEHLRQHWHGGDALPEKMEDAGRGALSGEDVPTMVHRLLTGALNGVSVNFWEARAVKRPTAPVVDGVRIEEHTHTKHNFQMFIAITPRVERVEFDRMLEICRKLGGWYSRQWGKTPGGFAFRDRERAGEFAAKIGNVTPEPAGASAAPAAPKADVNRAQRLRDIADKLTPQIEDKLRDRQTNTNKRLAQAEHARMEGRRLERTQKLLYALADMHDAGTVPDTLRQIKSKADAYELMAAKTERVPNGYHSYLVETGKPYYTTPEAVAAWALLNADPEREKQDNLRRQIQGLQFASIPGYFPTPAPVVALMLDYANVQPEHRVLEPSAGHGAICDVVRPLCAEVIPHEVNHTLSEILRAKGYGVERGDFMESTPGATFDRVLMNPPFENMQDVDHVRHAFDCLKDGGRLVAIMSAGVFFNNRTKATEFRKWLDEHGGEVHDLPDGSFKESGTGVSAKLVVIDKS